MLRTRRLSHPTVACAAAEWAGRPSQVADRMVRMLRRASLEHFFTADQFFQLLKTVRPTATLCNCGALHRSRSNLARRHSAAQHLALLLRRCLTSTTIKAGSKPS